MDESRWLQSKLNAEPARVTQYTVMAEPVVVSSVTGVKTVGIRHQPEYRDSHFKKLNPPSLTPLPLEAVTEIELIGEMNEQWS